MRLFIAIQCPENIESILMNCGKNLENNHAEIKFADSFHITLKFLGEVEEKNILLIMEALSKIRQKKFEVSICGFGAFPSMNHPNVLWAGIESCDEINSLQKKISSSLDGFRKLYNAEDWKDFLAHITLGRVKAVYNKEKFKDAINKIKIPESSFEADRFILYQSILEKCGHVYNIIAEFFLD